jgi:translation initiation factor 4A
MIGSGRGLLNAETQQARKWKLDALSDLFEDIEILQAIIHIRQNEFSGFCVYKLASCGLEAGLSVQT